MLETTRKAKRLLLVSTALVAAGFGGGASAQSVIAADGVISVSAGLEGFIAATSQQGTGTNLSAEVGGADQSITQTDVATISTSQTLFGNDMMAETRLNQSTAEVSGQVPATAETFTGATSVVADGAVSINAGVGAVTQQEVLGSGGAAINYTSDIGNNAGPAANTATISAPTVSGAVTVSGNQTVADTLVNDAQTTISATGAGDGSLAVPVAIATFQGITPEADLDITVSADAYGDNIINVTDGVTSISGNLSLDENAIGARAATNTAVNDLIAGSSASPAEGGFATTAANRLTAGDLDTGAITAFEADFGVANMQTIAIDGDGEVDTLATTEGALNIGLAGAAAPGTENVSSGLISARGNSILSEAAGNTATNRGIVTTNGISGVSVGVASLQSQEGDAGANNVVASTTGEILVNDGTLADPTAAGGELNAVALDLSGNRIGADASSNTALNVAAVSSTGSLGGAESYVAGRQTATNVGVAATVVSGDIAVAVDTANAGSSAVLNNNEVFATAALNTQTNVLQNSGSSAFGASTMVGSSRQSITGGGSAALVTESLIGLTTGDNTNEGTATASLSNNTVLASALGNVSTTSISNSSARFNFTR